MAAKPDDEMAVREVREKRVRPDAQRSLDALLAAAKSVFARSGVDAPVREIADQAGVGIGTVYRHFPQRADLIAAVFRREIDACADAAVTLAAEYGPFEALAKWFDTYVALVATKRGLAEALHSGDTAFETLPAHREQRLVPAFRGLFEAAVKAGEVRADIDADDVLTAVGNLSAYDRSEGAVYSQRMVGVLVNGLRTPR